jgi:hypothetical protein
MIQEILDREANERDNLIIKLSISLLILSEIAHIYVAYFR